MRTVIILSFLALLVVSTSVFGAEPVSVGGDFGMSWLKNLPYQPETSAEKEGSGLWSWGGVPLGMTVVNDTLQPVINNTDVNYTTMGYLGAEPLGSPVSLNQTEGPVDFMYPFYSDDPWILAQHYGRPVRTTLSDLPDYIKNTIVI